MCVYVPTCIYIYIHLNLCMCMNTHTYICNTHAHTHTRTYVRTCPHTHSLYPFCDDFRSNGGSFGPRSDLDRTSIGSRVIMQKSGIEACQYIPGRKCNWIWLHVELPIGFVPPHRACSCLVPSSWGTHFWSVHNGRATFYLPIGFIAPHQTSSCRVPTSWGTYFEALAVGKPSSTYIKKIYRMYISATEYGL